MNTLKSLVCVCEMNSMKILVSGLWYEYFENSGLCLWYEYFENSGLHLHWLYFEIYV